MVYFGIPAAIFAWFILWLLPAMMRAGQPQLPIFATFAAPLALMLVAAFIAYRPEGRPWSWPSFRDRLRLGRAESNRSGMDRRPGGGKPAFQRPSVPWRPGSTA